MKFGRNVAIASAMVVGAASAMPAQAAIITNGDFKNGWTGWNHYGSVVLEKLPYFGIETGVPGDQFAVFNGGNSTPNGLIFQQIATQAGVAYRLTFNYMVTVGGNQSIAVDLLDNRSLQQLANGTFTTASDTLQTGILDFVATSPATTIRFRDVATNQSWGVDIGFGNIAIAAIPEPATWALMLIGFGLVGAATRYRRRRVAARFA